MKITILFYLFTLGLYANYNTMLSEYQKSHYKKVIQEAKHSSKEYSNPKLHLLWAKSELSLGNKNQAMSAFERVLILEEDNKEAKKALKQLYKGTLLNTNKRKNIQRESLNFNLNVAGGINSNININPSSEEMNEYYDIDYAQNPIETNFIKINASIEHTYHFEKNRQWFTKSSLTIFNQENFHAHKYDLFNATGNIGIGYKTNNFRLFIPISYDNLHYYGTHLMNRYSFSPTISIPILNNTLLNFNTSYINRDFKMIAYNNYDAKSFSLGSEISTTINQGFFHIGIKYENRQASKESATKFIRADFINTNISFIYPLNTHLILNVNYLFRKGFYPENIATFLTPNKQKRVDNFHYTSFKFSYEYTRKISFYIKEIYSQNNTNFTPTQYKRNVISIGIDIHY